MRTVIGLLMGAALLAPAGCGYHVVGTGPKIPAVARSISIELFENRSRDDGLEVHLRRALEDEFRRHGALTVVGQGGDLVLDGRIDRVSTAPVTRIGRDQAVEYQGQISLNVTLKERATGRVVYSSGIQESQDFGVVSGVVVASSPRFQRGLINPRDLPNLTSAQLTESRRAVAIEQLLDTLAHGVYVQAMEGF
jgi:Lipopolysaccharide-assembly